MKLSIIIPIYNEEKTIRELLRKINSTEFPKPFEVIIINDGSTDSSEKLIKEFIQEKENFKYLYKKNGGKGSAIKEGLSHSIGEVIAIQDADLEYDPEEMNRLVQYLIQNKLEIVYGNRFQNENKWAIKSHYIGNILISLAVSLLFQRRVTDVETCYKIFRKKCIEKIDLKSNDFRIETELTIKFLKQRYDIKEIPIKYIPRTSTEGKKITWKDGLLAIFSILYYRILD